MSSTEIVGTFIFSVLLVGILSQVPLIVWVISIPLLILIGFYNAKK